MEARLRGTLFIPNIRHGCQSESILFIPNTRHGCQSESILFIPITRHGCLSDSVHSIYKTWTSSVHSNYKTWLHALLWYQVMPGASSFQLQEATRMPDADAAWRRICYFWGGCRCVCVCLIGVRTSIWDLICDCAGVFLFRCVNKHRCMCVCMYMCVYIYIFFFPWSYPTNVTQAIAQRKLVEYRPLIIRLHAAPLLVEMSQAVAQHLTNRALLCHGIHLNLQNAIGVKLIATLFPRTNFGCIVVRPCHLLGSEERQSWQGGERENSRKWPTTLHHWNGNPWHKLIRESISILYISQTWQGRARQRTAEPMTDHITYRKSRANVTCRIVLESNSHQMRVPKQFFA